MANKRPTPFFIGVPDELMIPGEFAVLLAALCGLALPKPFLHFYFSMLGLAGGLLIAWLLVRTVERWRYYASDPEAKRPSLLASCANWLIAALLFGLVFWIIVVGFAGFRP
jgi:hypothetical protein